MQKYSVDEEFIFMVKSYDICDKSLRNNKMPFKAVANKLSIELLPKTFRLERLLVSRRILLDCLYQEEFC